MRERIKINVKLAQQIIFSDVKNKDIIKFSDKWTKLEKIIEKGVT